RGYPSSGSLEATPSLSGTFGLTMLNSKSSEITATHPTSLARLVDIARVSGPRVTMATALRTRSFTYRYVLAELATDGERTYDEIATGILSRAARPEWLAALA